MEYLIGNFLSVIKGQNILSYYVLLDGMGNSGITLVCYCCVKEGNKIGILYNYFVVVHVYDFQDVGCQRYHIIDCSVAGCRGDGIYVIYFSYVTFSVIVFNVILA